MMKLLRQALIDFILLNVAWGICVLWFLFFTHEASIQGAFDAVYRHWIYAETGAIQRWQEKNLINRELRT